MDSLKKILALFGKTSKVVYSTASPNIAVVLSLKITNAAALTTVATRLRYMT